MTIEEAKYEVQYAFLQSKDEVYFSNMVIRLLEILERQVIREAAITALASESQEAAHRNILNLKILK